MPTINHKINMRTLAALKRVYDAQFELYEYALHHSISIDYTQDVFMRRTLSDLADASEKILAHINLNDYDDDMHMYVRTALASVQNSLSGLGYQLQSIEDLDRRLPLGLTDGFAMYREKLNDAIDITNEAANILNTRLMEEY